jgi:F0F1-type ATP synthase delta subunit
MSYVASQYAEALFGMALEDDSTEKIFDLLLDFSKVFDEDINKFLNHPKILDSEQMKQLIQNLNRKQNREIKLENIVDLTIVGGLRIEYEGMVLDDTINNYLNNLKANLTK